MKQKAITISLIKNNSIEDNAGEQRMTSLEIAELAGKQHTCFAVVQTFAEFGFF